MTLTAAAEDILQDVDAIVAGWQERLDGSRVALWEYGQSYFPVMVGLVRALQRENAELRAQLPAASPAATDGGES